MAKRVTSEDVARLVGVSRATVSYVLNDASGQKITQETRERVLAAAETLGYVPSASATALKRGRTNLVLLDVSALPSSFELTRFLSAFALTARAAGMTVITHSTRSSPLTTSELAVVVAPFIVASLTPLDPAEIAKLKAMGVRYVDGDNLRLSVEARPLWLGAAGRLQLEVLAEAGHRKLACAVPADPALGEFVSARLQGVKDRAAERGIEANEVIVVDDDLQLLTRRLRRCRAAGVTAIAAFNDEIAFAVLSAAHAAELAVPADLAVIGYDDIPLARYATPPLTTVRLAVDAIATVLATDMFISVGLEVPPVQPAGELITVVRRESV